MMIQQEEFQARVKWSWHKTELSSLLSRRIPSGVEWLLNLLLIVDLGSRTHSFSAFLEDR